MSYTTQDFVDFLAAQTGEVVVPGPYVPETGRLAVVTPAAGAGYRMEGILEDLTFQVLTRSHADDRAGAEEFAIAVDAVVKHAPFPFDTDDGDRVVAMRRVSGAPAAVSGTPDAGRRYAFVATYLVTVAE